MLRGRVSARLNALGVKDNVENLAGGIRLGIRLRSYAGVTRVGSWGEGMYFTFVGYRGPFSCTLGIFMATDIDQSHGLGLVRFGCSPAATGR